MATAAFAVDLGGTVIANTTLVSGEAGDNASDDITASANFKRLRFEGYGEAAEGKFGGWLRLGDGGSPGFNGYAFWKPIDQVKVLIGGNPDGMYGKEGVTGWMFYQTPYDTDVLVQGNVWGWGPNPANGDWDNGGNYNIYGQAIKTRDAFYGGFGGDALHLNIKPIDMIGINLVLPYFDNEKVADVFGNITAQVDLNFNFGNIAFTFAGDSANSGGKIFAYYGGNFDALGLDFGVSYGFGDGDAQPIGIGLGVKFATDAFGIKFRTAATLAGEDKATRVLVDLLPYFPLGDNLAAFVSVGIGLTLLDGGDTMFDWHFNPYLQIGEEWGAKFVVGVKAWSNNNGEKINWAVPIAIIVGF
ncbi:hypothetical protein [Treponema sp. R8-4-B8]